MNEKLSNDTKRNYCLLWGESGLEKGVFCDMNNLSRTAFYSWYRQYKKGRLDESSASSFSAMTVAPIVRSEHADMAIPFEIRLPNEARIVMAMHKQAFVSFIQELCNATATVR